MYCRCCSLRPSSATLVCQVQPSRSADTFPCLSPNDEMESAAAQSGHKATASTPTSCPRERERERKRLECSRLSAGTAAAKREGSRFKSPIRAAYVTSPPYPQNRAAREHRSLSSRPDRKVRSLRPSALLPSPHAHAQRPCAASRPLDSTEAPRRAVAVVMRSALQRMPPRLSLDPVVAAARGLKR